MDFARVYALVAGFLEACSSRVAVVGGLGLHGHGVTRATLDLDLVTEAEAQEALVAFLEGQGYETLYRSGATRATCTRTQRWAAWTWSMSTPPRRVRSSRAAHRGSTWGRTRPSCHGLNTSRP